MGTPPSDVDKAPIDADGWPRSAVRNLEQAGVSRSVAMRITGHKTESIYRRYAVVADDDVRAALERVEANNKTALKSNVVALRSASQA